MMLAAFVLCGERGLTDPKMEALIRFVNRIAIDLTLLEFLENGEVEFSGGEDGRILWNALSPRQVRQRRLM